MQYSVYLHPDVEATIRSLGNISDVTNKILREMYARGMDYTEVEKAPPRDYRCRRHNVEVVVPEYLEVANQYALNTKKVSVRNILYAFVYQDWMSLFGWDPQTNFHHNAKSKYKQNFEQLQHFLSQCKKYSPKEHRAIYDKMSELLATMEGTIDD